MHKPSSNPLSPGPEPEAAAAVRPGGLARLQASGLSWPLIVALLTCAAFTAQAARARMLGDPDTQWHLAAGRWTIDHLTVPTRDPFSYTMRDAPWLAHEWLSEVLMAALHAHLGWAGLPALAVACYALTLAVLARFCLRRLEAVYAILLVALAAALMAGHGLVRPHILTWPLLAIWMCHLVDRVERGTTPSLWLAAVMLLWANLHGSFTLGLALVVPLALEAIVRAPRHERVRLGRGWSVFLLLAALASLVTPHGVDSWLFTLHVMKLRLALSVITEWLPPNFQQFQPVAMLLLLVLFAALSGRLRTHWLRALLVLGLVFMCLKHARYGSIAGMVMPVLVARALADGFKRQPIEGQGAEWLDRLFLALARPSTAWARGGVALGCLALLTVQVIALPVEPGPRVYPHAALAAARAQQLTGPVLNDYNFGGFLIGEGVPVFIDGRADMYGDEFIASYLAATQLAKPGVLEQVLAKHQIEWTMLRVGTPAIAVLDLLPGWQRVHADPVAVVHKRRR